MCALDDGIRVNELKEKHMKPVIACLLIVTSLLAGCVVEPLYRSDYRGGDYRGGYSNRDRDHDGVPNRYDRAPDNPRRN
jgi:hypothetical protein